MEPGFETECGSGEQKAREGPLGQPFEDTHDHQGALCPAHPSRFRDSGFIIESTHLRSRGGRVQPTLRTEVRPHLPRPAHTVPHGSPPRLSPAASAEPTGLTRGNWSPRENTPPLGKTEALACPLAAPGRRAVPRPSPLGANAPPLHLPAPLVPGCPCKAPVPQPPLPPKPFQTQASVPSLQDCSPSLPSPCPGAPDSVPPHLHQQSPATCSPAQGPSGLGSPRVCSGHPLKRI